MVNTELIINIDSYVQVYNFYKKSSLLLFLYPINRNNLVNTELLSNNKFISSSNFDLSDIINKLTDFMFKETMQILKPVHVQGFLDDLIGQRMFIEIVLFILCFCIILLFIIFIFNLIFLLNKDFIIKKFNNKFITFYLKYQVFVSKITLFYIPIFIITGLLTLCHGLHWLVTNQIPFECLEVDLHQFISSNFVLGLSCRYSKNEDFH